MSAEYCRVLGCSEVIPDTEPPALMHGGVGAAAVVDATEEQACALRQFVLWKNFAQILQGVGRQA